MFRLVPLTLIFYISLVSCRTKERPRSGKGGIAILNVQPQHHGDATKLIDMKVFIKYNTQEQPPNSSYDDSVNCITDNGIVIGTFTSLKDGDYYLLSKGYDTAYRQTVRGGIPYRISEQTVQNVTIPVTE